MYNDCFPFFTSLTLNDKYNVIGTIHIRWFQQT